jgi:hypothetical protein
MLKQIFFSPALQPPWALACESQFHDYFTDGRPPWTSDDLVARPLSEHRTTQTQNTHIPNLHVLCGVRTHDPGFRACEDSTCFRLLDYRDRQNKTITSWYSRRKKVNLVFFLQTMCLKIYVGSTVYFQTNIILVYSDRKYIYVVLWPVWKSWFKCSGFNFILRRVRWNWYVKRRINLKDPLVLYGLAVLVKPVILHWLRQDNYEHWTGKYAGRGRGLFRRTEIYTPHATERRDLKYLRTTETFDSGGN